MTVILILITFNIRNAQKSAKKRVSLAWNPNDTTGKELYSCTPGLIKMHDEFLAKSLEGRTLRLWQICCRELFASKVAPQSKRCWVLKHSVAKRLLKTCRLNNYETAWPSSVDSMLKREKIDELFVALHLSSHPPGKRGL